MRAVLVIAASVVFTSTALGQEQTIESLSAQLAELVAEKAAALKGVSSDDPAIAKQRDMLEKFMIQHCHRDVYRFQEQPPSIAERRAAYKDAIQLTREPLTDAEKEQVSRIVDSVDDHISSDEERRAFTARVEAQVRHRRQMDTRYYSMIMLKVMRTDMAREADQDVSDAEQAAAPARTSVSRKYRFPRLRRLVRR